MCSVYLDNAATTPLAPEVREAMEPWGAEQWGNPSSVHAAGVRAREAVDRARDQVARAVGGRGERVVFTGSASEANNLALFGVLRARRAAGRHLVIGPTEHASVRASAEALAGEGVEVDLARLDAGGALDLEHLASLLRPDTALVAQLLVSNEFGSVYPVAALAGLVRARAPRAHLHVDAVQALGKLELSIAELRADSLSLSAHKAHGPQGVGALVLARELALRPLVFGGGQEHGLRAGTENVAGVVGFGAAAELAHRELPATAARLVELRARLAAGVAELPGFELVEPGRSTAPPRTGILSLTVPGPPAEVWLHHLDARGVAVGTGSACQANKRELSPAFAAAGLSAARARRVLRLSLSRRNTVEDIDRALTILREVSAELSAP